MHYQPHAFTATMSVFSLDVAKGNPVTRKDLEEACNILGVSIKDEEKAEYVNLLAVYHDSMVKLMNMEGEQLVLSQPPRTYDSSQTTFLNANSINMSARMSTFHLHRTIHMVHGLGDARSPVRGLRSQRSLMARLLQSKTV